MPFKTPHDTSQGVERIFEEGVLIEKEILTGFRVFDETWIIYFTLNFACNSIVTMNS
jgi:hypothetical protein